jgi:PAS domain S-box-containing protein
VMALQRRQRRITSGSDRRSWSLRQYVALFIAVLLIVAGVAAFAVRTVSEQDARQSAVADTTFASQKAAAQLDSGFEQIRALSIPVAKDPNTVQAFADPTKCRIGYAPIAPFATGHIDLIRLDGSVACSSRSTASLPTWTYAGQAWLQASASVVVAPVVDAATGNQVVAISYPVLGAGFLTWFLDLAPIGPQLASEFGSGVHQLEFLITSPDGRSVVSRSIEPARWVGSQLSTSAFAGALEPSSRPDLNGTRRIYVPSVIGSTGWHLYVGADEAAALSAADQAADRGLAIILAGMGVMLVAVFVVYRRIAEPVRRLSLVMRGTTPGAAVNAVAGTGATEVTDLAEDFDKLMATVKDELAVRLGSEHDALVSERNYRMLFEGHPQPMWLYDVHTLAFLNVNDAAVEHYGYSREEFLNMTVKDIRPPQDIPKFIELIAHPMPTIERTGPWRHRLKNGSYIQVLITSHAVTFGEHEARVVLAEDLTESQRLELDLHQSQARSEANAELSRAKDEMLSMVSHEMRTPLASMVGFAELLTTRDVTPQRQREYLGVVLQEGHRLTALINDFLDLRRIEGGHTTMRFAPADLGALIGRVVDVVGRGSDLTIKTDLPEDLPLVRADSDSIFRVMANLLSNANKYSPNGGSVVVSARVVDDVVEVSVKDEGLGVPAGALPRVFDRFYRVDSPDRGAIKGTGLGLAISKHIVEAHGGGIGVFSAGLGKGSTFHFTLPIVRNQAQIGDVLVVEDDSGFAHLLEAELNARGVSSVWAADAETAEHLMTQNVPRAVVLDLRLPGLQGEAFLLRLRERNGVAIPVVVVTLKDLDLDESLALQKAGVTAVLRKGPGMAESAANLIAKALAYQLVPA